MCPIDDGIATRRCVMAVRMGVTMHAFAFLQKRVYALSLVIHRSLHSSEMHFPLSAMGTPRGDPFYFPRTPQPCTGLIDIYIYKYIKKERERERDAGA